MLPPDEIPPNPRPPNRRDPARVPPGETPSEGVPIDRLPPLDEPAPDAPAPAGSGMFVEPVLLCCYCARVRGSNGAWSRPERPLVDTDESASHGVCPTCYEEVALPAISRLFPDETRGTPG